MLCWTVVYVRSDSTIPLDLGSSLSFFVRFSSNTFMPHALVWVWFHLVTSVMLGIACLGLTHLHCAISFIGVLSSPQSSGWAGFINITTYYQFTCFQHIQLLMLNKSIFC
ncbi:unnamed protein product [Cylicocyclus nassatus]|uniref:Uncharacterized protein n=1 Tax=Cylicocyclus nassatus TaxID=53992 RepID=A0AA36GWZ7_CYLNA|nr:unnamed protein product [Cylicocyclus nassatus]